MERSVVGMERTMTGWSGRAKSMLLQNALKFVAIRAAERQLGSIAQDDHIIAPKPRLQFFYAFDIHDYRAMNSIKFFGIEFGFNTVHCVAQQVIFGSDVEA